MHTWAEFPVLPQYIVGEKVATAEIYPPLGTGKVDGNTGCGFCLDIRRTSIYMYCVGLMAALAQVLGLGLLGTWERFEGKSWEHPSILGH